MISLRRLAYVVAVLLVVVVALTLRLRAVQMLPADYDEPVYLAAAQRYAQAMAAHDVRGIIDYEYNYEHPPLTKLAYGLAILPLPPAPLLPTRASDVPSSLPAIDDMPQPHFRNARLTATAFSTLEVLALAILDPLAGLILAISTWQIKYTSQIMLEPLPALMSALAVLCYVWGRRSMAASARGGKERRWSGWFVLSAVALGLTEASKYTYGVAAIAILVDWLWATWPASPRSSPPAGEGWGMRWVRWLAPIFLWGAIAVVVFVAADPRLWSDPLGRLKQSLSYHGAYTQSATVRQANLPAWQPFVWLFQSVPWHPGVFIVGLDVLITILAGLGLRRLWQTQRVFGLWLVIGLGFLLLWPTKWPQYVLTITAPLALAAAVGFRAAVLGPLQRWVDRVSRGDGRHPKADRAAVRVARREARGAVPWLLPGMISLGLLAVFPLIYQAAMALTDFNLTSIRDGMTGGVWRAVWEGLTGQARPVMVNVGEVFRGGLRTNRVHYAGPGVFLSLVFGSATDLLVFNVMWTVLSVGLQAALGIGVALMLNRRGVRLRGWWRTVFILPWAIPEFVGALIWMRIFEPGYGWLVLAQNLPWYISQPSWYQNPNYTLMMLLVAATWYGFPLIMLAATAGLKLVPPEVYAAAAIDGAGGWQQFRFVTWPLLLPLVAPALIIRSIFAFNQFYLFYTMRVEPPLITFATASFYFFEPLGSFGGQFAVSAAINIFTVLVLVLLILWFDRWSKAAEGVTYV